MNEKVKTMHEFYAPYWIEIDYFIFGFDDKGFEYFYENVILKMGSKPDVKYNYNEMELDLSYKFGADVTGIVYELKHMFEGLQINLEYTLVLEYRKICNMFINYTVNGTSDFIYSNFFNSGDFESDCDELLGRLRNLKLKMLIDEF